MMIVNISKTVNTFMKNVRSDIKRNAFKSIKIAWKKKTIWEVVGDRKAFVIIYSIMGF